MKYVFIVKEGFTDKYTNEEYEKGKELTVDEKRGEELKKVSELVELKEIIEDKPKTEESKEDKELEELKEKAKKLGIKVTNKMKKETIIEKIAEIENAEKEEK